MEFKHSDLSKLEIHWCMNRSPAIKMDSMLEEHFVGGDLPVGQRLLHPCLLNTRYAYLPAHWKPCLNVAQASQVLQAELTMTPPLHS